MVRRSVGRIVHAEDGAEGGVADEGLRGVRAAVCVAQEVGARLGHGQVLLGTVPRREGRSVHGVSGIALASAVQSAKGGGNTPLATLIPRLKCARCGAKGAALVVLPPV